MAACPAHHAGYCHENNHSLHLARKAARYVPSAACVLPLVSRHDLRVYVAGYTDEEDICVEVWGVAVGGWGSEEEDIAQTRRGTGENSLLH